MRVSVCTIVLVTLAKFEHQLGLKRSTALAYAAVFFVLFVLVKLENQWSLKRFTALSYAFAAATVLVLLC